MESNQLLLFERIISGNLSPWLDKNKEEGKFEAIIGKIEIIIPCFQPLYEIDFYRCFGNKTKYYQKLIINEANACCNSVIELINTQEDIGVKKYLVAERLKKIKVLLMLTVDLINANCYQLQNIDTYKSDFNEGRDHKTDTYVIQLLKTALLKVYLEIQEAFRSLIAEDDFMEIEDLYLQVLSEPIPGETFLRRRDMAAPVGVKTDFTEVSNLFWAKSFRFDRLGTNPGALHDLFDSLIRYGFIDKATSIKDFKKIFSGGEIGNPIRWTGNDSEFYWFIHLIYTKYKFVEDLRQQQWKVAGHCFVKADGTRFDIAKVRNLKKPMKTGWVIEKAVKLLM